LDSLSANIGHFIELPILPVTFGKYVQCCDVGNYCLTGLTTEDLQKFLLSQQRFDIVSEVFNAFDASGALVECNRNGICLSGPHGNDLYQSVVLCEPKVLARQQLLTLLLVLLG
jgi:hypothetical protein